MNMLQTLENLADSLEAIDAQANEMVIEAAEDYVNTLISNSGSQDVEGYTESFKISYSNGYFMVLFEPKTEQIGDEEKGKGPYSIKETMLNYGQPGVKVSKDGYLYRNVPLHKKLSSAQSLQNKSQAEQDIQGKIRDALARVKFNVSSTSMVGGKFTVEEKANDNSGLIRVKTYNSEQDYLRKRIPSMSFVVFRAMSTNPKSASSWISPGFDGNNFQSMVEQWLRENQEDIRVEVIEELLEMYVTGRSY